MSEPLSAFDLLENDYNGAGLRQIQEALVALKLDIKGRMDRGLAADEFPVAQRALLAVETAEETVVQLHDKMVG